MNKGKLIFIAVVFVCFLAAAAIAYPALTQLAGADVLAAQDLRGGNSGDAETEPVMAPELTVYDEEGNEVLLSEFFGKPIVLNFWASWCGPCKSEMPDFNEKYLELGEDVTFLMVNLTDGSRETVSKATRFVEDNAFDFPVYFDKDSGAASIYGVFSIPTTYFIDVDGYLVAKASGAIDKDTLQIGIDMVTADTAAAEE